MIRLFCRLMLCNMAKKGRELVESMFKYRLHGAVGAAVFMFMGQVQATTLQEAVREAVETNPRIEAAQASYRATLNVLDQARGRLFPEVDVSADIGRQRVDRPNSLGPLVNDIERERRQVTLTIRQILFDGWDRANDIYRSHARINAALHKILARSEAVALNAIEAYIDVNRHERLLFLARKHVQRHEALLDLIQKRLDGGAAPVGDLEQTLERLEAAKALVAQIDIARSASIAKYKAAVGSNPSRLGHVNYARNLPKSQTSILKSAVLNNPRLHAADSEIDIANFDKEQFKSNLFPTLSLEGTAKWGDNLEGTPGKNDELNAMLVLRWKLFDGGIRRARIAELSEREYEKLAERDILLRDLEQDIFTTWARFSKGWDQVGALRRQSIQNKKVIATYQDEYDANKRSLLDVLDAENSNFATEFELSNVTAQHVFSTYQVLAQMGVLLERFGISRSEGTIEPYEIPDDAFVTGFGKSFVIPPLR